MKETTFIAENKEKWKRFEKNQSNPSSDPKELGDLYSEINSDLSYAQTFYKRRTVRAYLNGLAQGLHNSVYRQKASTVKKAWEAWTVSIPIEIYNARKNLLFALVLFIIYALIGAFSTHIDIGFAETVLGRSYVALTESNIADEDPLAIYRSSSQGRMFLDITLNNIKVALLCFFSGVLFSLGTHLILFKNAVMVGVFQYFFKLKGLLLTSFLTIWIHGAFEISAIVIASGAGFTIGHGLLFPGSFSRLQSFQISARRGVRIMLSLIPIFIIAGFLESFVTRHYLTLPNWSKWLIVLFSFAFILFYYVIYPALVARKYPEKVHDTEGLKATKPYTFQFHNIRDQGAIFSEAFYFYRAQFFKIFKPIMRFVLPMAILLIGFQVMQHFEAMNYEYEVDWIAQLSMMFGNLYFIETLPVTDTIISFLWLIPLTIIAAAVYFSFQLKSEAFTWKAFFNYLKKNGVKLFFATALIVLPIFFLPYYLLIGYAFLLPFFLLFLPACGLSNKSMQENNGFKYGSSSWSKTFVILIISGLTLTFLVQPIAFIFSLNEANGEPLVADFLDDLTAFIKDVLRPETKYYTLIANVVRQIIYLAVILLFIPFVMIAAGFLYYSADDKENATSLKEAFKKFGTIHKTQETEADYE